MLFVSNLLNGRFYDSVTNAALISTVQPTEQPTNPCNPSPCGANALCKERNGAGSCTCLPDYFGDPYSGCRPECIQDSECDRSRACVNNKCVDPCIGICGGEFRAFVEAAKSSFLSLCKFYFFSLNLPSVNAECRVQNHSPNCMCIPGYTGDPIGICTKIETPPIIRQDEHPCSPSPCGPHSQCKEINGHSVCSCLQGFIGAPPQCRPECTTSNECALTQACNNFKCIDPCPGTCGQNARCEVHHHSPICSCGPDHTGDPFRSCQPIIRDDEIKKPGDPCVPSPCGPSATCRNHDGTPSCQCLPGYIGAPPNCRPECVFNDDCPARLTCLNNRCKDPCPGSCGGK